MRDFVSVLLRLSQVPKLGSVRIQQILAHVNIEQSVWSRRIPL